MAARPAGKPHAAVILRGTLAVGPHKLGQEVEQLLHPTACAREGIFRRGQPLSLYSGLEERAAGVERALNLRDKPLWAAARLLVVPLQVVLEVPDARPEAKLVCGDPLKVVRFIDDEVLVFGEEGVARFEIGD